MVFDPPFFDRNLMGPYNQLDPEVFQDFALSLARFLCNGDVGRQEGDPVFELVTEERQSDNSQRRAHGSKELPYSCCTDEIFFILYSALGAGRVPLGDKRLAFARQVINRDEAFGWRPQVAVSLLRYKTGPHFHVFDHHYGAPWSPPPASVILFGENGTEHVALSESVSDKEQVSLDYGQFWANPGQPGRFGGRRVHRTLFRHTDQRLWARSPVSVKPIIGYLDTLAWLQSVIDADDDLLDALIARGAPLG